MTGGHGGGGGDGEYRRDCLATDCPLRPRLRRRPPPPEPAVQREEHTRARFRRAGQIPKGVESERPCLFDKTTSPAGAGRRSACFMLVSPRWKRGSGWPEARRGGLVSHQRCVIQVGGSPEVVTCKRCASHKVVALPNLIWPAGVYRVARAWRVGTPAKGVVVVATSAKPAVSRWLPMASKSTIIPCSSS